ncbi:MAG: hypothetical protein Q8T11_18575 [Elusimicrobiota bacterium]|nr:hypothetical protein [Elusimicrobiota bacterium]
MKTIASALFTAVNFVYAAIFGGPIDGSSWDVKVKQDGFFHWGSKKETLVFHGGKLVVAGAVSQGYSPTLYQARDEENGTVFAAVLNDPSREAVEWTGRVVGDRIAGVVIVRERDGRVVRYAFTGERKAG